MITMAGTKIQAAERSIVDIFSDAYSFRVPRYQRPYAWTTDEASELLEDLIAAAFAKESLNEADPYFLGSIVLVKEEGNRHAEIVDGQQRLTTLVILLSALRHHVSDAYATSLNHQLFARGDPIKGTIDQPRLRLRDRDQPFFEKYIQSSIEPAQLDSVLRTEISDSRANLARNSALVFERLRGLATEQVEKLATFVGRQTYLVMVSTQDFESAYRIFTVLNERGLDLVF